MNDTLVSAEACVAFPISVCIAIAGLAALLIGWQLILDALLWRRLCAVSGGRASALKVLEVAEATCIDEQESL